MKGQREPSQCSGSVLSSSHPQESPGGHAHRLQGDPAKPEAQVSYVQAEGGGVGLRSWLLLQRSARLPGELGWGCERRALDPALASLCSWGGGWVGVAGEGGADFLQTSSLRWTGLHRQR